MDETRAKYNTDDLKRLGAKGQAFKNPNGDWSFPIADGEDLSNAIQATGRFSGDSDALRRYIMRRARALGLAAKIPDSWMSDGSLKSANSAELDGLLERSVPFSIASTADEGQTLEGYAAVFNSPTRIDSWEGMFDEVIAPGAFRASIRNGNPVLMFEHGKHPLYGSMPIGAIRSLKEDAHGLFVSARLFDNWLNEPLRDAINSQAVDGMSFRFSVPKGKDSRTMQDSGVELRTVHEAKLYELGPVVFPAYKDTTVALRCLDEARTQVEAWMDSGRVLWPETSDTGSPEEPADEAVRSDPPSDDPVDDQSSPSDAALIRRKHWQNRAAAFQRHLARS